MIKLLFKDDWVPPFADKVVFIFAPTAIVVAMMMGFAVVPFAPDTYHYRRQYRAAVFLWV